MILHPRSKILLFRSGIEIMRDTLLHPRKMYVSAGSPVSVASSTYQLITFRESYIRIGARK